MDKKIVKIGCDTLERRMTMNQAVRHGDKMMPGYLRRAGFETIIFSAAMDINGWDGYRINYSKR